MLAVAGLYAARPIPARAGNALAGGGPGLAEPAFEGPVPLDTPGAPLVRPDCRAEPGEVFFRAREHGAGACLHGGADADRDEEVSGHEPASPPVGRPPDDPDGRLLPHYDLRLDAGVHRDALVVGYLPDRHLGRFGLVGSRRDEFPAAAATARSSSAPPPTAVAPRGRPPPTSTGPRRAPRPGP